MHNHLHRNIKLYPEEWEALERIAKETYSHAMGGTSSKQPTWVALIRRIARGEVVVVEKRTPERERLLTALDAAISAAPQGARDDANVAIGATVANKRRILPGQQSLFENEPAG